MQSKQNKTPKKAAPKMVDPNNTISDNADPNNRTDAARPEPIDPFNFFSLPNEVRNMVYDEAWKCTNRVAAYHPRTGTGTGILAYYGSMALDKSEALTRPVLRMERDQLVRWRPGRHSGLPRWLLADKQMMREALAQFRLKAHWNIWPIVTPVEIQRLSKTVPKGSIMSPAHARSLSIARMAFGELFCAEYAHGKLNGVFHIALDKDDQDWLHYLVQNLGNAPQVRTLKVALGIPQFPLQRTAPAHQDITFRIKFRFPYHSLIVACERLTKLNVELFRFFEDHDSNSEFLDVELLECFRSQFKATMGANVTETLTSTESMVDEIDEFGDRQLLDHELAYTKG
jgi:hypothetical protein